MKIRKYCIFFATLVLSFGLYAQNISGQIVYKAKIHEKSSKNKDKPTSPQKKEINEELESIIEIGQEFILQLAFNNDVSHYVNKYQPLHINRLGEHRFKMAQILFKVDSEYYFFKKNNELIEVNNKLGEQFLITSSSEISDWKLSNESKLVKGFKCFKAQRSIILTSTRGEKFKRSQIVWYTKEIPVPYGPSHFVGFPGLVLQAFDAGLEYYTHKITLNPFNSIQINTKISGQKVSKEKFAKITSESLSSFINLNKNKLPNPIP